MKVLHVTPSYIPAYRYGGPVRAVHELCKMLVRKGVDVTVFTTNIDLERTLDVPLGSMVKKDNVPVFYYPTSFLRTYCYSRGLARALRERVREFDVVHIHSVYLYPTFIASYWCRTYQKPHIVNPFGALDPDMIRLKSRLKKLLYINAIEKRTIKKATAIHASSRYEEGKIASFEFEVPIFIVPRGVVPSEYAQPKETALLRERFPALCGKKILLFMGRLHQKKGFDLLIPAFKRVIAGREDICLVIAGADEYGYKNTIEALVKKEGIEKYVIFAGMLLGDDKISALHASDAFILPSYGENFGYAVVEAMACGLPVIITDKVGIFPDVEEAMAGIVTHCNPDSLARAIINVFDDATLKKSMGENGKWLVRERFNLTSIGDRMIEVYEDMLTWGQDE